tara:strand:- start:316 stop:681 length:366 start_codon:yes stop_codon:yes gene_type:complete
MKTLQEENLEELTKKVYDLINITSISLGFKTDGETMAAQAKILAQDLQNPKNRFNNMYFSQIKDAFYKGVRDCKFDAFINIPTFFKWIREHKKIIAEAIYKTETLNQKNVEFYQEPKKLLK